METILFHCPQMTDLAKRIASQNPNIRLGKTSWKMFEDGWPNYAIQKEQGLRRKRAVFLASFDTPADVFKQLSMIFSLPRLGAKETKVVLPYYPTGTMERGETESVVVTAETLARQMSAIQPGRSGPVELVLYDVHSLDLRHYFGNSIMIRYKTGTKYLKKRLEKEDVSIAFPDVGAWKRFRLLFDGSRPGDRKFPIIICDKVRDGDKRSVTIREGEVRGRHVVVVDDIIKSGGTILECRAALTAAGASAVSAFATHGSFPKESWKKFLGAGFQRVWITESCPQVAAKVAGQDPFEIISLAQSVARAILDEDDEADEVCD